MGNIFLFLRISFLILLSSSCVWTMNRIEGQVFGPDRNPLVNVDVELMNDVNAFLARTTTDSAGHFSFLGVSQGRFIIKFSSYKLGLREKTEDVDVNPPRAGASDTAYVDVYMTFDRSNEGSVLTTPDTLFVQDVPPSAKELYEKGLRLIQKKPEEAFADFENAITIFPNYFDAYHVLGREYIIRKNYRKGYPYLLKAIDINPKSSSSYYSLGYAFLQLNELPAALEAARASVVVNPAVVDSQILYGNVLRLNKKYDEAEKVFLKAKSLAKKPIFEISRQLALVYNRLNRNEDAANELESYLKASPKAPERKEIEEMVKKLRKVN